MMDLILLVVEVTLMTFLIFAGHFIWCMGAAFIKYCDEENEKERQEASIKIEGHYNPENPNYLSRYAPKELQGKI